MTLTYVEREKFVKGADLGTPENIALVKAGGIDGREIVGKDALLDFLVKEGIDEQTIERAVDETKDDEISFPFVLSTNAEDRQRDVIKQSGWKLDNYRKNPVVLWAHDYSTLPVARASAVYIAGDKLKAVDRFSNDHELARTCAALYRKGFLNAVSVGFRPLKWAWNEERGGYAADFEECELLEHSAVPVPAHQDALIEARAAGLEIAPVIAWAEKALASTGGLILPKAFLESAIVKTSTRFVLDLGDRATPKAEALPEPAAPVVEQVTLASVLEFAKANGLAICSSEFAAALAPKATPPAVVETASSNSEAVEKVDVGVLVRDELRGLFKGAFLDPLAKFVTANTGRLDEH